jgi:hypothetical protein
MVRLFSSMCACDACATCACSWWFVCDPYLVPDDVADDVTDDVTARMNQMVRINQYMQLASFVRCNPCTFSCVPFVLLYQTTYYEDAYDMT